MFGVGRRAGKRLAACLVCIIRWQTGIIAIINQLDFTKPSYSKVLQEYLNKKLFPFQDTYYPGRPFQHSVHRWRTFHGRCSS